MIRKLSDNFDEFEEKVDELTLKTRLIDEYHDPNFYKMLDYLFFNPSDLELRKMTLSHSTLRNRYKGLVRPSIKFLDIDYLLKESSINYDEMKEEQGYINNRLIPYMKTHKLSYPIIEIYNDLVDNQRPIDELTGKRPRTHIYIPDGNHRIVAMKRLEFKRIPCIVYEEPKNNKITQNLNNNYDNINKRMDQKVSCGIVIK